MKKEAILTPQPDAQGVAVASPPADQPTKKTNKALEIIANIVLVLALLLGIFASYTAYTTEVGSGVANIFGFAGFSIQTDSMSPTFASGDLVIDKVVTNYASLEVGDVITFWTIIEGETVLNTHRITAITDYGTYLYYTTKGDANSIEDSLGVHQSEVVGEYLFHVPNVGTAIDFLQTPTGFFVVIVVPVFLFFIYNLVVFFKALFAYQGEKMRLQVLAQQEAQSKAAEDAIAQAVAAATAAQAAAFAAQQETTAQQNAAPQEAAAAPQPEDPQPEDPQPEDPQPEPAQQPVQ